MPAVDSQYPVGFSWVESKLITGPDNNIWFVSPAYSKVGRINTAAGTVSYFDLPIIGNPQIAAGSDGNIYVTGVVSYWDMKLWKISTAGTVLNTYTIPVNPFPRGLASDPSGALYFPVIGDGLYRLSFTGTETKVASFTEDFRTIAYNGGAFWVAEWGNSDPLSDIAKITTAGTVTNYVNGHPSNEHYAMMDAQVGPDGNVWFSGNKLVRMKPDGTITEFSFGSLAGGLGLGSDGKLYLGNAWNAILKIQPGN